MKTNSISYASDFLIHLQKNSLSNINLADTSNKNEIIEAEVNIAFSARKAIEIEKIKKICIDFFNTYNKNSTEIQYTIIEIAKILD